MTYDLEDWQAILEGWELDLKHAEESVKTSLNTLVKDLNSFRRIKAETINLREKVASLTTGGDHA